MANSIYRQLPNGLIQMTLPGPKPECVIIERDVFHTPLTNLLNITVNLDTVERSIRLPPQRFIQLMSKATYGTHFAPRLVEVTKSGDSTTVTEVPDSPDEDQSTSNPVPDDSSDLAVSVVSQSLQVVPGTLGYVLEPDTSTGQMDARYQFMLDMFKAIGLTHGNMREMSTRQTTAYHVIKMAMDIANGSATANGPYQMAAAVGPYLLRAPIWCVIDESVQPNEDTHLPDNDDACFRFARFLAALDAPGWGKALTAVRNDDPRLEGGHPNSPQTNFMKRLIIAERMHNLLLAYRGQLRAAHVMLSRPAIEDVLSDTTSGISAEAKAEIARVLSAFENIPLNPVIAQLVQAALKATASPPESGGTAVKAYIVPTPPPGTNSELIEFASQIPARARGKLWTFCPWVVELVRLTAVPGWADMLLEPVDATVRKEYEAALPKERRDVFKAVCDLVSEARALADHVRDNPSSWTEATAFCGWAGKALVMPPFHTTLDQAALGFTDGVLTSEPLMSVVNGDVTIVPARIRKLYAPHETMVTLPNQRFSVLPLPVSAGEPERFRLGYNPLYTPKWAYMGEPAEKVYLRTVLEGLSEWGLTTGEMQGALQLLVGPKLDTAKSVRRASGGGLKAYNATHMWPSAPGAPVYAVKDESEVLRREPGLLLTGARFTPGTDLASLLDADAMPTDLPDSYNNDGGTLFVVPENTVLKPAVDSIKAAPATTLSAEQLGAALDGIEVRTITAEGVAFAMNIPLVSDHGVEAGKPYAICWGGFVRSVAETLRPRFRVGPEHVALSHRLGDAAGIPAAIVPTSVQE